MTLIWLGVILVFGGVLQIAFQPIWRGRLSGRTRLRSRPSDTLEPERPAGGFGIKTNWPGLALVALGAAMSSRLTSLTLSGRCAVSLAGLSVFEPCLFLALFGSCRLNA